MFEAENFFYDAMSRNDLKSLKFILSNDSSFLDVEDSRGQLPIDYSRENCGERITRCLLRYYVLKGTDAPSNVDMRYLFVAIELGNYSFLRNWLLEKNFHFNYRDLDDRTSLHYAAKSIRNCRIIYILKMLIDRGARAKAVDKDGLTPIHLAAESCERDLQGIKVVRSVIYQLVRAGCDINARDKYGRTALHLAIMNRKVSCIFSLLRFGANVEITDNVGLSALDYIFDYLENLNCLDTTEFPRRPDKVEKELLEMFIILFYHICARKVIGLKPSDTIQAGILELYDWYEMMAREQLIVPSELYTEYHLPIDALNIFLNKCEKEREKLEQIKLDNYTSLQSFILKSKYGCSQFAKKQPVKEYFESGIHIIDFPICWYILQLKYEEGAVRNELFPFAREALSILPLPDLCLEAIIDQLTNFELIDLIEKYLNRTFPKYSDFQIPVPFDKVVAFPRVLFLTEII